MRRVKSLRFLVKGPCRLHRTSYQALILSQRFERFGELLLQIFSEIAELQDGCLHIQLIHLAATKQLTCACRIKGHTAKRSAHRLNSTSKIVHMLLNSAETLELPTKLGTRRGAVLKSDRSARLIYVLVHHGETRKGEL